MKREASASYQTPVKKWIQLSPFQEENLAIIESEDSAAQPELFSALVGATPSFHDRCLTHSPHSPLSDDDYDNEDDSLSLSLSLTPHSPSSQPHSQSIPPSSQDPLKEEEPKTSERLILRPIDQNRKGCNCRNSKCDKNYCDCLRSGMACGEGVCSCVDCMNTEQRQEKRETIRSRLEEETTGVKGCRCRKSKCQKKYCECHNAGRKCSPACFCMECNNQPHHEHGDREGMYESIRKLRKGETQTRLFVFR